MSKTKGGGSTRNGRDSRSQRLGVKVFDGTAITAGTGSFDPTAAGSGVVRATSSFGISDDSGTITVDPGAATVLTVAPNVLDTPRELAEAKIAAYITKTVAAAPPLTEMQRARLAPLLLSAVR